MVWLHVNILPSLTQCKKCILVIFSALCFPAFEPENLRVWTLFTHCSRAMKLNHSKASNENNLKKLFSAAVWWCF